MSFADLKRRSGNINKLVEAADKLSSRRASYTDERIWKPTKDNSGNAYAVIRFLPAAEGNDLPWNQYWDHGFQGPTGQWYIEKSRSSIGEADPVGELNARLYNSSKDPDSPARKQAAKQKRRLHYVSNIYVVSDPGNPANEGKVMIFQYGKKIFDKIMDAMKPEYEDETPIDPFDMWKGANFKLKLRKVDGWDNYDKSEFSSPAPLSEDDEELEKVYNKLYDLREFTDPSKYKTYDQLTARLKAVLGEGADAGSPTLKQEAMLGGSEEPREPARARPAQTAAEASFEEDTEDDAADTLSYFAKLASGD